VADVAITNHALEHIPFPIEALRQLKTKIKPGGALVICLPMEDWRVQSRYTPEDIPTIFMLGTLKCWVIRSLRRDSRSLRRVYGF
jgi:2-polyprenyl-3-methyl-5-hydroxy-6-metoxy-1,4-benzoquinol methylase